MQKLYFTYRQVFTNTGSKYDISYFNDKQYADYVEASLTKMTDGSNFIPEDRITSELVPGVKSLRRAGLFEFDVNLDAVAMQSSLENVAKNFGIEIKTIEEMKQWIRDNTDLTELSDGQFEIYPESIDQITGENVPAKTLIIN